MLLKAKNFLSWKDLEFKAGKGVTMITGFNYDDNTPEGSGKSAILNGFCWGFFGCIPKDAGVDDVVREGSSGCEVDIIHDEFRVHRSRSPNDLYFTKGDGKPIRGKDARATQKMIEQLIGFTFESFCQAVYYPQNYTNKFVTANQEKKGQILSEILDLEQFDRARDDAGKQLKVLKEKHLISSKDMESAQAQLGAAVESEKSYITLIDKFNEDKVQKIQNLFVTLEETQKEAEEFQAQFEAARQKQITAFKNKIKTLKNELQEKHKELEGLSENDLDAAIAELRETVSTNQGLLKLNNEKLNKINVSLATSGQVIQAHKKVLANAKNVKTYLEVTVQKMQATIEEIKEQEADVASKQKILLAAEQALANPSNEDCPTCGQVWSGNDEHYEKEYDTAQANYEKSQKAHAKLLTAFETLKEQADGFTANLAEINAEIQEYKAPVTEEFEAEKQTILELNSEIEQLSKECISEIDKCRSLQFKAKMVLESIANTEELIQENEAEISQLKEASPKEDLEKIVKRIKAIESQIEAEDLKEPVFETERLENSRKAVAKFSEALKKATTEREALANKILKLDALRDGFREVKSYTFQNVLAQLSRKANAYLGQLFEQPVRIKFVSEDMKINVMVTIDGKERVLGLYSGGQFRRIALAVDLALSDITSARKSNKLNLLIMDEYCKDLSEISMEKVLKILQSRSGSTLLIEHNSIFKSIVTQTFDIELRDKVSRRVQHAS